MHPSISLSALAVLGAALQGCASPQAPALQTVRVQTPGCAIARCELSNDHGSWVLAQAPGSVTVSVSRQPLTVSCQSGELTPARAMASSSRPPTSGSGAVTGGVAGGVATGMAFGGVALTFIPVLGVITVLAGAGAGAAVGEAAESNTRPLRYPELLSVAMRCSAADATPKRIELGLGIRGLDLTEAVAAGLEKRTAVLVTGVSADGRAAAAGLRSGDLILALNGHELGDAADLEEQLLALPNDSPLALHVWRDRRRLELRLTRSPGEAP